MITKIIGNPGAGKTRTLIDLMLESGVPWNKIAFTSLTNASVGEARKRAIALGADEESLGMFRTMHSLSKRLLGLSSDNVAKSSMDRFAEECGYKLSKKTDGAPAVPGTDDFLLQIYDRARNLRLDPVEVAMKDASGRMFIEPLRTFIARYEAWKNENDKFDFIDMVEQGMRKGVVPDADIVFFDEFQDFSPLLVAQAEQWSRTIPMTYLAGDYNQAIYEFMGTDPSLFKNFPADETITLTKSWRVPRTVASKALSIIRRNSGEEDYSFDHSGEEGHVMEIHGLARVAEGIRRRMEEGHNETYFFLSRTNYPLIHVRKELVKMGVPCGGRETERRLVSLFLRKPKEITRHDVDLLIGDLMPSRYFWEHGAKAAIRKEMSSGFSPVRTEDLGKIGAKQTLIDHLTSGTVPPDVKMERDDIAYYEMVERKWGGKMNVVELLSIHGSKGREADIVFILTGVSKKIRVAERLDQIESERRVWYVALTRAKKAVIFVEEPISGCSRSVVL